MYLAKERGRVELPVLQPGLAESVQRAFMLETRMREAIKADAFALHYQPQVRVSDGRWSASRPSSAGRRRTRRGSSPRLHPDRRAARLIRTIGRWVLREACRQNVEWQAAGSNPIPSR
jgi:EAL domain-containing protein (putative c-di-GMP-specific phosphodiesterase class I)